MEAKILTKEETIIRKIQRDIDIIIAFLLLTGQITLTRVYFGPGYFGVTVGGPLTGANRLESFNENPLGNATLDIIDIIIAILILKDEINLVGLFVASDARFSLSISGPLFGREKVVPVMPYLKKNKKEFDAIVADNFLLDKEFLSVLKNI